MILLQILAHYLNCEEICEPCLIKTYYKLCKIIYYHLIEQNIK